jgi:hypothetical protein
VEGQQYRSEVHPMTAYKRKVILSVLAKSHWEKHVWYYVYDSESGTWTRSRKFRWFGGRLIPSGKEVTGLKFVPELQISELKE